MPGPGTHIPAFFPKHQQPRGMPSGLPLPRGAQPTPGSGRPAGRSHSHYPPPHPRAPHANQPPGAAIRDANLHTRTFERLQQVLPHVPAGCFKVGKLSQAAQFQPPFHFVCSGNHSKQLSRALSTEQVTLRMSPYHSQEKATPRLCHSAPHPAWLGGTGDHIGMTALRPVPGKRPFNSPHTLQGPQRLSRNQVTQGPWQDHRRG